MAIVCKYKAVNTLNVLVREDGVADNQQTCTFSLWKSGANRNRRGFHTDALKPAVLLQAGEVDTESTFMSYLEQLLGTQSTVFSQEECVVRVKPCASFRDHLTHTFNAAGFARACQGPQQSS